MKKRMKLILFFSPADPSNQSIENLSLIDGGARPTIDEINWFMVGQLAALSPLPQQQTTFLLHKERKVGFCFAACRAAVGRLGHRLFSLHSLCCFHYWFHQYFQSTAARENCATFSSCSANQFNQLFFFCFLFLAEPHAACGGHNPPIKRKEKQLISLIFFAASLAPFKRN